MSDPLDHWSTFTQHVRARLEAGRLRCGDRSFDASPAVLVNELQQEALDLAGWGYVLHERLERARAALAGLPGSTEGEPVTPPATHQRRSSEQQSASRSRAGVLMGLDISATAAAACAVPLDWDGDFERVRTIVLGEGLRRDATDEARAQRCESIARGLVAFAQTHRVSEAWIEGYAFSRHTAAHTLAEVGGVVRLELVRAGVAIRTANMSTARKLLLGKLPRKGPKHAAHAALHAAGSPAWTLDEADAFVAVNLGLSEHVGAFCFAQGAA